MSGPLPVNIGVEPIAQAWVGKPVHMRFVNDGKLSVLVHAQPVELDITHGCKSRPDTAVKIMPAVFSVKPLGGKTVTVTVPDSGAQDLGVLFVASATGSGSKGVSVQSAVGSQVTTHSHLTCGRKIALAAPTDTSGISTGLLLAGLGGAVLLTAIAVVLAVRTWKRRSKPPGGWSDPHWQKPPPIPQKPAQSRWTQPPPDSLNKYLY